MIYILKQKIIIILFVFLFFIGVILFFSTLSPTPSKQSPSSPIIPTPTFFQTQIPPKNDLEKQTISDENFSSWVSSVKNSYPWYRNLPLQTEQYFLYFDLQKKGFIGKLYPKKNNVTSIDQQVANFKTIINNQLKNLGIDINLYQFEWIVEPE